MQLHSVLCFLERLALPYWPFLTRWLAGRSCPLVLLSSEMSIPGNHLFFGIPVSVQPWSATSPLSILFGNGPSFGTCGLVTDTGASPSRSKFHVSLDSNSQPLLFVSSICSFSCRGMWSKDSHKDRTECLLLGLFLATLISIRYFHDHCGRVSFLARYQV